MLLPHVLIARASRAYRSWAVCLSLAGRLLIARGPSAYRSWAVCLSRVDCLLIARLANNLRNLRYLREIKYYREK